LLLVCFCSAGDACFLLSKQRLCRNKGAAIGWENMLFIVELIQQLTMHNEQNQSIETISVDRHHTDLHQTIDNIDPVQSFHLLLAIFAIFTSLKNLRRYARKLMNRKGDQIDLKLNLQIVGAILAILKGIAQLLDILGDRDEEE
jgi:hypothetical protein